MDKKVRIATIGCGVIARDKHVPALIYHGDRAELAAFCDPCITRAEELCRDFGTPGAYACDDYEKVLADSSIDAVPVCTPNATHSVMNW